jgi:signal peptidase II
VKITRLGGLAYLLALLVIAIDQASKAWILGVLHLQLGDSVHMAGPLSFTLVQNHGVSFGLLWAHHDLARWGLAAFSIGVAILLAGWARKAERPLTAVSLGLIIGGALGNVIDRLRFGWVTDFLDVSPLHFPWVINVADASVSTGVVLLLLDMLRSERRTAAAKPSEDAA